MLKWMKTEKFINYPDALEQMEQIVSGLISGNDLEHVWLLEHPELYTAGTSANLSDLIDPDLFPVYSSQRGGQYTYHGPGQRIAYTMLDLNKRGKDVRKYVHSLEEWIIQTLAEFDIKGERRKDRVGVWVVRDDKPASSSGQFMEDKIAAVGVRLRKWISFHGIAINVNPNLNHYKGIVPCGIQQHGVTSLADLGLKVTIEDLDKALIKSFDNVFEKK
ncbi:lipoyl(octanoyl) transferase LipB [Amylibacter sp.]|nr:lipoyl(octanoyl) transferase LipB [Amylibacter sp.]MDB2337517.1 lipoyl(octanoyl) transferase LipB [Amylibacter sp.]MDB9817048.1 lipoyl(octanoyl) transferase LipB [Amylibacter sp.]MDB9851629.1 lipoyl(octanoyl) transferase LipB [Amylibacter sp.]